MLSQEDDSERNGSGKRRQELLHPKPRGHLRRQFLRTNTSLLWKANATTLTTGGDSTFSTASSSLLAPFADEDEGTLSDPDPNEEAYIPLTPYYLGEFVERAIKVLVDHYETIGKPYVGATKEGVLSVLRRDDRWRYVGE